MKYELVLCLSVLITPTIAVGGNANPNSNFKLSRIVAVSPTKLHVENVVRQGKVLNLDLVRIKKANQYKEVNRMPNPCSQKAPTEQDANDRYGSAELVSPHPGFESIIGWINVVNNGSDFGQVHVRSLILYGVDPDTGHRKVVDSSWISNGQIYGYGFMMDRVHWPCKECWTLQEKYKKNYSYGTKEGKGDPLDDIVTADDTGAAIFPISSFANKVFHAWSQSWPRKQATKDLNYEVEAEVLIEGKGMIQIGYDFWTKPDSGSNEQGAVSFWECSSTGGNWVKVKAGLPSTIDYAD